MCGKGSDQMLKLTGKSKHFNNSFASFITEVMDYINKRFQVSAKTRTATSRFLIPGRCHKIE